LDRPDPFARDREWRRSIDELIGVLSNEGARAAYAVALSWITPAPGDAGAAIASLTALRALPAIAAGDDDLTATAYGFLKQVLLSRDFADAARQRAMAALFGLHQLGAPSIQPYLYSGSQVSEAALDLGVYSINKTVPVDFALTAVHMRSDAAQDSQLITLMVAMGADSSAHAAMRSSAVRCVGICDVSDETLGFMIELSDDPALSVRSAAASSLVLMGNKSPVAGQSMRAVLINATDDDDPYLINDMLMTMLENSSERQADLIPILHGVLNSATEASRVGSALGPEYGLSVALLARLLGERYFSPTFPETAQVRKIMFQIASNLPAYADSLQLEVLAGSFARAGDTELAMALQAALETLDRSEERDHALEVLDLVLSDGVRE
jgi:hypothetical protein